MQVCANDPLAGMGEMSIVRAATEVPGTGLPSLSALWDAMGLAIGKLCRSVSAGIGPIGVLSSFPMRCALRAELSGREKVKLGKAGFPMVGKFRRRARAGGFWVAGGLAGVDGIRPLSADGLWMGRGGQTGGKGGRGEREKGGRSVA